MKHLDLLQDADGYSADDWDDKLIMADTKRKEHHKKRNDKHNAGLKTQRDLEPGDLIFLRTHGHSSAADNVVKKMIQLYVGPYICKRIVGNKVAELIEPKTGKIIGHQSFDHCKLWEPTAHTYDIWLRQVQEVVSEEDYQAIRMKNKPSSTEVTS